MLVDSNVTRASVKLNDDNLVYAHSLLYFIWIFNRIISFEKENILYSVNRQIEWAIIMKAKRTQALTVKSGPTESGNGNGGYPTVGGEMVPVDKLSVFLSSSWLLILLILIVPIAFILYRKRDVTLKILSPLVSRLFEFTQRL